MEYFDDKSDDQDEPMPLDALAIRLREEAMAERPSYSMTLHNHILNRTFAATGNQNSLPRPSARRSLQMATVAAALLITFSLTIHWYAHRPAILPSGPAKSELSQLMPTVPQTSQSTLQTEPILAGFMMDAHTFFTKKFWPLEIIGHWPGEWIPKEQQPPEPQAQAARFPSMPELMFALLRRPTSNATAVFANIIPPQLHELLRNDADQNNAQ